MLLQIANNYSSSPAAANQDYRQMTSPGSTNYISTCAASPASISVYIIYTNSRLYNALSETFSTILPTDSALNTELAQCCYMISGSITHCSTSWIQSDFEASSKFITAQKTNESTKHQPAGGYHHLQQKLKKKEK